MEGASSSATANAHSTKPSPEIEEDSSKNVLKYARVSGFATTDGQDYEVMLVGFLFLRLLKRGQKFQLASNVQGAGALDDIVFRFQPQEENGNWKSTFVQLKHRSTWINHQMLTNSTGAFYLAKYFESYLTIKQAMSAKKREILFDGRWEDCQFVVFTNAKVDAKLLGGRTGDFSQAEECLWSGTGSVFNFEKDKDVLKCLSECGVGVVGSGEEIQFLNRLQVFCGQPGVNDLKEAIKKELKLLDTEKYGDLYIELLCEYYLTDVRIWWASIKHILDNDNDILKSAMHKAKKELDSENDKTRLQESSKHTVKDFDTGLVFEATALLTFGKGLFHMVASESSCRLTFTKLMQDSKGQCLLLSCEQLAANQSALLAECRIGDLKTLVVCTKDWRSERRNEYFNVISEMLAIRDSTVSVVLVSDGTVSDLTERFQKKDENDIDNFKFSQLKQESRDIVLKKVLNFQGIKITFGTLFNNFIDSVDQVLSSSLVVEILAKDDPVVGSALPGGIKYYVERTLEHQDQVTRFEPKTVMDLEERLVVVCAEPGMGKSTLMARLAKNTKELFPHYFVFLITLYDHANLFDEKKHVNELDFLSIASNMDSSLQRSLLEFALTVSGNVVVIVDGFDEIEPKFFEQSCQLLSSLLKSTKVCKIWIASRNSVKPNLEKRFNKVSFKICEFNREGQKYFLTKFWEGKSCEKKLNVFIDELLDKVSQVIQDKEQNILGIPLQTRMLAEVYEGDVVASVEKINLPDKLDLLSLMEKFFDKKYKIHFRDTHKISTHNPNKKHHYKVLKEDLIARHAKAGLLLILGDNDVQRLGLGSILSESSQIFDEIKRGAYQTGFIDEIVNGKPRFIHRVFAEYLVAQWITRNFKGDATELVKSKMFTPGFTVIRYFFNGILCKGCALHTAVLQEEVEKVKTLLKSKDIDLNSKDGGDRTAFHLAASLGASKDREINKRRCEILDQIIDKYSDFKVIDNDMVLCGSPLRYADITRWWTAIDKLLCKTNENGQLILTLGKLRDVEMLDTIFEQDLDKLLRFCLDKGLEVEHRYEDRNNRVQRLLVKACEEGSVKVASLLIKRNADINITESDELSVLKHSPLITASRKGYLEIVKLLVKKYVATLSGSLCWKVLSILTIRPDASKYINMKNTLGTTAMHWVASEGHTDVITYLISQGGDPQSRNVFQETPFHEAAEKNKSDAISELLKTLSEADRVTAIKAMEACSSSLFCLCPSNVVQT